MKRILSVLLAFVMVLSIFSLMPLSASAAGKAMCGDADSDGKVTIMDATRIQRWLAQLCDMSGAPYSGSALTTVEFAVADADTDNMVTIMDATAVQRHIADLPTNKKIGTMIEFEFDILMMLRTDEESILADSDHQQIKVYLESNIGADSVSLYYGVNGSFEEQTTMFDNGYGADDMAGDGIYTANVYFEITEDCVANFVAEYLEEKSNTVSVNCYVPISEETYEAIASVEQSVEDLKNSAGFEEKDDDQKAVAVTSLLNKCEKEGLIEQGSINSDPEAELVSFMYPEGILGGVRYDDFDGQMNGAAERSIAEVGNSSDIVGTGDDSDTIGSAIILNSFPAFETKQVNIDFRTGFYQTLRTKWNNNGLATTLSVNPTVEDYKNLSQYNVICISTHGEVYSWNDGFLWMNHHEFPAICLAQTVSKGSYDIELKDKQIVISGNRYEILPSFFEKQYSAGELTDTFVFSECCQALGKGKGSDSSQYDYSMANAFLGRGASAYIGFHNSVFAVYSRELMETYIDSLIEGKTSQAAYSKAISVMGADHSIWFEKTYGYTVKEYQEKEEHKIYNPKLHIAYPVHNGDSSARLIRTGIQNGDFELFDSASSAPLKWTCIGDVRTVTQLGSINLPEAKGQRMAIVSTGIGAKTTAVMADGTEGSMMSQSFRVPADANKLTFKYNMVSEEPLEYVGSIYNDSFVLQMTKGSSTVFSEMLESINTSEWKEASDIDFAGGDSTVYQTGWKTKTVDISAYRNTIITLRYVIYDVGDSIYDSAILIDNAVIK